MVQPWGMPFLSRVKADSSMSADLMKVPVADTRSNQFVRQLDAEMSVANMVTVFRLVQPRNIELKQLFANVVEDSTGVAVNEVQP